MADNNEWEITNELIKKMKEKDFKNLSPAEYRFLQEYVLCYGSDEGFDKSIYKVWEDDYNRRKKKFPWWIEVVILILLAAFLIFVTSPMEKDSDWENFVGNSTECISSSFRRVYRPDA